MSDYWLQLYRQGLWTQLRPTSTSPPPLLSLQTDWTWFFTYLHLPFTYLHMFLLVPGNSSFHFWIHILCCRHKSSFQDCCGKSNALGSFWDWHIHPHLVSRNENPIEGRGGSVDRRLKRGDSLHLFATWCSQIPRLSPGQTPRERHSLMSEEQWRRVSRQRISCLKLETHVPNNRSCPPKTHAGESELLPLQVKRPPFPGVQLFPVGEEKPVLQLHLYLPGRFLQIELEPHGVGLWEHSSISGEKKSQSYKSSSNTVCIFQRCLKQCLLFHIPLI